MSYRSRLLLGNSFVRIGASIFYFGHQCWAFEQNQTGWVSRLLKTSGRWTSWHPGKENLAWYPPASLSQHCPTHACPWLGSGRQVNIRTLLENLRGADPVCRQPEKCIAACICSSWGSVSCLYPMAMRLVCWGMALKDERQVTNFNLCIPKSLWLADLADISVIDQNVPTFPFFLWWQFRSRSIRKAIASLPFTSSCFLSWKFLGVAPRKVEKGQPGSERVFAEIWKLLLWGLVKNTVTSLSDDSDSQTGKIMTVHLAREMRAFGRLNRN